MVWSCFNERLIGRVNVYIPLDQHSSLWRCSFQPISWLSTEETKPNTAKAKSQEQNGKNIQKSNLNVQLTARTAHLCVVVHKRCTQHRTEQFW